ncbi:hypothetical protein BDW72DRAFT_210724 [Aspergillus terricola var. indicus]
MQVPATGPNPSPSQSFTLFPHLPTELRLQIWTLVLVSSLSERRTVSITCHREVHPTNRRRYAKSFSTSTSIPALLHVNREARSEALRVYRPSFARIPTLYLEPQARIEASDPQHETRPQSQLETEEVQVKTADPRPIYIAFNHETLQLREDVLSYIPEPEMRLIERMVVGVADLQYFGHFYLDVIRRMNRLRKLELIVGVTHNEHLPAGTGQGTDASEAENIEEVWERTMRRFEWEVELLTEVFRDAREENKSWLCPDVRIVMRRTGAVIGVIEGGRGAE